MAVRTFKPRNKLLLLANGWIVAGISYRNTPATRRLNRVVYIEPGNKANVFIV